MAKKKVIAPVTWYNRIVDGGVMAANQFTANPDNWRKHPEAQEQALVAILDRVGWVQNVLVSKRSGYVIDGHLRVLAALRKGEDTPVPYTVVDVDEHEEALLLSSLDPLSALATTDQVKYAELVNLLPDELRTLADMSWGERAKPTTVQFTTQPHHRVIVECADEHTATNLQARLTAEGFQCTMKS